MNSLEVLGAATIWCAVGLVALLILLLLLEAGLCAFDRWRIRRAVWWYKEAGFIDADTLRDHIKHEAQRWWKYHEREKCWSRSSDYEAGMEAAIKHLVREHVKIAKVRRK